MSHVPQDTLGEEREIDVRSAGERLLARWWLLLGGLFLGAAIGVLVAAGAGHVFEARTLLYMGQPFYGGGQIQSLATNPRTVSELIRAESVVDKAADASGLTAGQLRGNITSEAIATAGTTSRALTPLVEIIVLASAREKAERAADSLARAVVSEVGSYVDIKVGILNERIDIAQEGLQTAARRIETALEQQRLAATSTDLSLSDRILVQANANTSLQFYEARSTNLRADLNEAKLLLSLAENVERSRIVEPARAVRTTATSRSNGGVVGAVVGLLLGGLAALLWDPVGRSRKRSAKD